ncbi:Antennal esterase CXE20 [Gryllus bimaculatus]|nr:Antennal esterase CXE20 [Gryllus bimaculatus]
MDRNTKRHRLWAKVYSEETDFWRRQRRRRLFVPERLHLPSLKRNLKHGRAVPRRHLGEWERAARFGLPLLHCDTSVPPGLFHGAISVSGSALPSWARVQRPREQALALRRRFAGACPQLPEEDIVSCLRKVDAQELVFNQYDLPREPYQRYILKNTFLPSVETASSSNSPFLTNEPEQLMKEGNFTQVPYMTGFTNGEGIMILHFSCLCTDTFFASGTATSARLMAHHGAPVYVYQFSRDGPIAFLKDLVYKATHIPGVMHGDDMAYVFDFIVRDSGEPRPVPSSERPLRERQVQFIEQFVKYGRPTQEENGGWPLFTSVNETYLDINRELSTNQPVLEDRANFWRRLVNENFSNEDSTRQLKSRKR